MPHLVIISLCPGSGLIWLDRTSTGFPKIHPGIKKGQSSGWIQQKNNSDCQRIPINLRSKVGFIWRIFFGSKGLIYKVIRYKAFRWNFPSLPTSGITLLRFPASKQWVNHHHLDTYPSKKMVNQSTSLTYTCVHIILYNPCLSVSFFEFQIAWNTSASSHQKVLGFANLGLLPSWVSENANHLTRHPWCHQVARYLPLETSGRQEAGPRLTRSSVTARNAFFAAKLQDPKEQTNHTISPASHMSHMSPFKEVFDGFLAMRKHPTSWMDLNGV